MALPPSRKYTYEAFRDFYGRDKTMSENIQVKDPDGKEYTVNPADLKLFNEKLERDIKAVKAIIAKLEKVVETGGECWPFGENSCELCEAKEPGVYCSAGCPAAPLFKKRFKAKSDAACGKYIATGTEHTFNSVRFISRHCPFAVKQFLMAWAERALEDFRALLSDLKAQR